MHFEFGAVRNTRICFVWVSRVAWFSCDAVCWVEWVVAEVCFALVGVVVSGCLGTVRFVGSECLGLLVVSGCLDPEALMREIGCILANRVVPTQGPKVGSGSDAR